MLTIIFTDKKCHENVRRYSEIEHLKYGAVKFTW